jgi:hypothetical protein
MADTGSGGNGDQTGASVPPRAPGSRGSPSSAPPAWMRNATVWVGAALSIGLLVLLGVAVLPDWWAAVVGGWVDGDQTRGVLLGLVLGVVFTLLPLALGLLAMRSGLSTRARLALIASAVLLLLPNVLTVAIALSSSDARAVIAIDAPGLRGATVVGIGVTLLVVAAVLLGRSRSRRTRREVTQAQERAARRSRDLAAERDRSGTQPGGPDGGPAQPE